MMPRKFAPAVCSCLLLAATAASSGAAPAAPPNIVYIMADDLGIGDIGPFGQKRIRTPFLDRMAAEGTCFDQFFPGATVCSPTRSVLMTGLHTGHAGGKRGQYSNDLMTDEALAFIESNRSRPFFVYLAYTIPHALLEVPDDERRLAPHPA